MTDGIRATPKGLDEATDCSFLGIGKKSSAKGSPDVVLLGDVSRVGKALGEAVTAIPVGDLTQVDEPPSAAAKP